MTDKEICKMSLDRFYSLCDSIVAIENPEKYADMELASMPEWEGIEVEAESFEEALRKVRGF